MPKKRNSTESDNDEQANESSGSLSQTDDNAKRAKFDLLSDTTLQDLPIKLLELILIKAVVMEVKGLKLAKCAWKEKVDPVISRLKQVCSHWSNILTSNYFQAELHRTLDDTAQDPIRLEVLQELSVKPAIHSVAALKDEIFTLTKVSDECYIINVYDRDNMEEVKDVIKLPESDVKRMTACNASNCVYVGLESPRHQISHLTVLRIRKDAEHQFNISPWKHVYERTVNMLSVTANGCLLTFTNADRNNPASVAIHDANDSFQFEVFLPRNHGTFLNVIQKSNGNFVMSCFDERDRQRSLLEIDTTGSVVRQYQLGPTNNIGESTCVNFADNNGRILITECHKSRRMEILDSEFNLLSVYNLQEDVGKSVHIYDMKYDSERSEIIRSHYDSHSKKHFLTTFRFTEE